jgi:hypothetical protein
VADATLEALPDSKVKTTLQSLNAGAQDRPNQYKKSDVTINPTADVYNSSTVKRERAVPALHNRSPEGPIPIGTSKGGDTYQGGNTPISFASFTSHPSQPPTTRRRRHRKHI